MPDEGAYGIGAEKWPGLAKLSEEMGELNQVLMKLVAMDGKVVLPHWDGKGSLLSRLLGEMGDVEAALTFFRQVNRLPYKKIEAQKKLKLDKFHYWQKEAKVKRKKEVKHAKVMAGLKLKKGK